MRRQLQLRPSQGGRFRPPTVANPLCVEVGDIGVCANCHVIQCGCWQLHNERMDIIRDGYPVAKEEDIRPGAVIRRIKGAPTGMEDCLVLRMEDCLVLRMLDSGKRLETDSDITLNRFVNMSLVRTGYWAIIQDAPMFYTLPPIYTPPVLRLARWEDIQPTAVVRRRNVRVANLTPAHGMTEVDIVVGDVRFAWDSYYSTPRRWNIKKHIVDRGGFDLVKAASASIDAIDATVARR